MLRVGCRPWRIPACRPGSRIGWILGSILPILSCQHTMPSSAHVWPAAGSDPAARATLTWLAVEVRDGCGDPVVRAAIIIKDAVGDERVHVATAWTGAAGTVRLRLPAWHIYHLAVQHAVGTRDDLVLTLISPTTVHVQLPGHLLSPRTRTPSGPRCSPE